MSQSTEPQPVQVVKVERKRNPLGIVLCAAFLIVAAIYLVKYHYWLVPLVFTAIGLACLTAKESR
jgi:hypothetical protein